MPARFDWQADDEREWGELAPNETGQTKRRALRRRLLIIAATLMVALIAAVVAATRIERFLANSTVNVEQDVLSSHELMLAAVNAGDSELFHGMILDRLEEWTEAQMLLVQEGLLLDRSSLDLYLPANEEPQWLEVELTPNLRNAEVHAGYRYNMAANSPAADSVILQQLFTYRLQDGRWLLNPPTGAFWGPRQTTSGRYLTLTYPERDGKLGRRLAADMEATVGRACHLIEQLECPPDLHLEINLVADPGALLELSEPASWMSGGRRLDLPAPTLVGLPVDEPGYRVLYRAYARQVVAGLVAERTDLACCQGFVFADALLDVLLGRMGLVARAEQSAGSTVSGEVILNQAEVFWIVEQNTDRQVTEADRLLASTLVAFLVDHWSGLSPADMLRLLGQASSFREWLNLVTPGSAGMNFLEAWEQYLVEYNPYVAPDDWPDQVILMMCDPGMIGSANLYRYDPAQKDWSIEMSGREFIQMEPLPDGNGVVLTEILISQDGQRQLLWPGGQEWLIKNEEGEVGQIGWTTSRQLAYGRRARQNGTVAWSDDGRWQARLEDGRLVLSAPTRGYHLAIETAGVDCRALAWVREQAGP